MQASAAHWSKEVRGITFGDARYRLPRAEVFMWCVIHGRETAGLAEENTCDNRS